MSQFAQIDAAGTVLQVIEADQEFIDTGLVGDPSAWLPVIPEGSAGNGFTWDTSLALFVPPGGFQPTLTDLYAERSRRLAAGFDYDFGDDRGVHRICTSEADMIGWNEVTTLAGALMATGQDTETVVIVTETGVAQITAAEWQQVLLAAAQFRQPIWAASFALQALPALPYDFRDDSYWAD